MRYLVERRQANHSLWYWQPTATLRAAGFRSQRLASKTNDIADAIQEAAVLNAELDQWYAMGTAKPKVASDTLSALDALFKHDEGYERMAARTRRDYGYNIKAALDLFGLEPVRVLDRQTIRDWYRQQVRIVGPSSARNQIAALRRLLSFGYDEGWIPKNPATDMRVVTPPSRDRVWTLDERDRFVGAAIDAKRLSMAVAVMLGWCLGQRPADLRKLGWSAYDGSAVQLRQAKTGSAVWVPALPELRRLLDGLTRVSTQIVVSETTARPYEESAFQHLFAEIRSTAGLPADLQFRDLRRTLATALGAAGCSDDQIRAITGHKTRDVLAVYVRPDRTFAEGAMAKLDAHRGRKKV